MAELAAIGDQNLRDISGKLFLEIKRHLDGIEDETNWKSYLRVLSMDRYNIEHEIRSIESSISPTTSLFLVLGGQGMTINEFVQKAVQVGDNFILSLFNVFIPAQITKEPMSIIEIIEGDSLNLSVRATGFPPPKYKWYRNEVLIHESSIGTFCLSSASPEDSGNYLCLVDNSNNPKFYTWTQPITVNVLQVPEIEIKQHPVPCTVSEHGNAVFRCEVWEGTNPQYQWYFGKTCLKDAPGFIQGSNTNELHLYNVSPDFVGCYTCLVQANKKFVMSKGAILRLSKQESNFTATDKVALLIGNYDYRSDNILTAPKYDVQTLATIFHGLNFKVVSLLNLTKTEILAAVYEFKKLIGQGVYCVFYFCGHGFEVANQCFLVPTDAPVLYDHKTCVSADVIFGNLLKQEPQICCMILDICRKVREGQDTPGLLVQRKVDKGNSIVCYGTSYGLAAYEDKQYGILVHHLKNFLALPINIESVFQKLRIAISEDEKVGPNADRKQIPEVRTNLQEVNRSFTDPIKYNGYTQAFNERQMFWEYAHSKPDPFILEFQFPNFCVTIRLDFQQEFSNVLKIYTSVVDPGPTSSCIAFISAIPIDVAERAKTVTISHSKEKKLCKNYVTINNIQRLKSDMKIILKVKCTGPHVMNAMIVELGLPLVAKLELWKERQDPSLTRTAHEVDDDQYGNDFVDDFQNLSCHE